MKPPPFAYVDPATLPDALAALHEFADEGKVLAGGQSLLPLLNMRLAQPDVLIDVNHLSELAYIRPQQRNDRPGMTVGALTRQSDIEKSQELKEGVPLLSEAIGWVGHPQIRNRGTVGGSIAHADPAAELPVVFRALDGIATVASWRGRREISAEDFFVYSMTPALEADELLLEIWLPSPVAPTGHSFIEVARRHGDFALVSVAVTLALDSQRNCTAVRIALGGTAPVPHRAKMAEEYLRGRPANSELFREAGRLTAAEVEPTGDIHADAAYRRDVAGTLTTRALMTAFSRVTREDA